MEPQPQQLRLDLEAANDADFGPELLVLRPLRVVRPAYDDPAWQRSRQIVFERDRYTCQSCYAMHVPLELDHIQALCRGGDNSLLNLQAICRRCHGLKSSMDLYKQA